MLEQLVFAFNVVFPLFALIMVGILLKQIQMLEDSWVTVTNRFVFRIALPATMFNSIYSTQVQLGSRLNGLIFVLAALLGLFLLALVLVPRLVPQRGRRGVIIQGLVQSNTILLGIPLITNLYGEAGGGELSALLALVIPFFNIIAVLSFSLYSSAEAPKATFSGVVKGILTNPLILATAAGLLLVALQLRLPVAVERSIAELAKIASPLSLLALGAGFQLGSIGSNLKQLLGTTLARLVLIPAAMIAIAVQLGFRGPQLAAMLIIFAAPLAVASFVMSYEYGADSEFCGQLIVFTTLGSCFTLFGFIFALSSLGLL